MSCFHGAWAIPIVHIALRARRNYQRTIVNNINPGIFPAEMDARCVYIFLIKMIAHRAVDSIPQYIYLPTAYERTNLIGRSLL